MLAIAHLTNEKYTFFMVSQFDLRESLLRMNQREIAICLAFLAGKIGGFESGIPDLDANVFAFVLFADRANPATQMKLFKYLARLLEDPGLLHRPRRQAARHSRAKRA